MIKRPAGRSRLALAAFRFAILAIPYFILAVRIVSHSRGRHLSSPRLGAFTGEACIAERAELAVAGHRVADNPSGEVERHRHRAGGDSSTAVCGHSPLQ